MRSCFFTSIALNYLPKALALAKSVLDIYPQTRMVISIIDLRWLSEEQHAALEAIRAQFSRDHGRLEFIDPLQLYSQPNLFRYKYSVVEACTAIKPAMALHLLKTSEEITYLDPDTILYAPLPEGSFVPSNAWDIQVTPHVIAPAQAPGLVSERLFMYFGIYNLGYFSVHKSSQATGFLEWWDKFCFHYGANAPQAGLFVDQKPVDLLTSFVDKVDVLRHPGCNVAWWNLFSDGRRLTPDARSIEFNGNVSPLVFFHFSNMDREPDKRKRLVANPVAMCDEQKQIGLRIADHPALEKLFDDYDRRINEWKPLLGELRSPANLNAQHIDAPPIIRMLLSEALRRGLSYDTDPYADGTFKVLIKSTRHILGDVRPRELKALIAANLRYARLSLSSRLLRHSS